MQTGFIVNRRKSISLVIAKINLVKKVNERAEVIF